MNYKNSEKYIKLNVKEKGKISILEFEQIMSFGESLSNCMLLMAIENKKIPEKRAIIYSKLLNKYKDFIK